MAARHALVVLAFLAGASALGCGGSKDEAAVCAAGSSDRFEAVQQQAPFAIYCPTWLPDGFVVRAIEFGPAKRSAEPLTLDFLEMSASFFDPTTGGEIWFSQGSRGSDMFPAWRQYGDPPSESVQYGDFTTTLYHERILPDSKQESAVIWGDTPDGRQLIVGSRDMLLDAATLRHIAEAMKRL